MPGDTLGQLLPGGPAIPARPFWSAAHRDIPWWFADTAGPSDAYDISVIYATKINSGGNAADYEMAIISPPNPLGSQGVFGTTSDLRWWPAGAPTTAGTFTTSAWAFEYSYTWDETMGTAVATMTLSQGATVRTATANVTQRVLAFVNGGDPDDGGPWAAYAEPHTQRDLLLRLAVASPGTTFSNTSVSLSNLRLTIDGGAPAPLVFNNPGPTDALTVQATDDPAYRQVGFIFADDVLTDHTTDFTLRGDLNFGYTRLNAGGPPSGANVMFELKVGDLEQFESARPAAGYGRTKSS